MALELSLQSKNDMPIAKRKSVASSDGSGTISLSRKSSSSEPNTSKKERAKQLAHNAHRRSVAENWGSVIQQFETQNEDESLNIRAAKSERKNSSVMNSRRRSSSKPNKLPYILPEIVIDEPSSSNSIDSVRPPSGSSSRKSSRKSTSSASQSSTGTSLSTVATSSRRSSSSRRNSKLGVDSGTVNKRKSTTLDGNNMTELLEFQNRIKKNKPKKDKRKSKKTTKRVAKVREIEVDKEVTTVEEQARVIVEDAINKALAQLGYNQKNSQEKQDKNIKSFTQNSNESSEDIVENIEEHITEENIHNYGRKSASNIYSSVQKESTSPNQTENSNAQIPKLSSFDTDSEKPTENKETVQPVKKEIEPQKDLSDTDEKPLAPSAVEQSNPANTTSYSTIRRNEENHIDSHTTTSNIIIQRTIAEASFPELGSNSGEGWTVNKSSSAPSIIQDAPIRPPTLSRGSVTKLEYKFNEDTGGVVPNCHMSSTLTSGSHLTNLASIHTFQLENVNQQFQTADESMHQNKRSTEDKYAAGNDSQQWNSAKSNENGVQPSTSTQSGYSMQNNSSSQALSFCAKQGQSNEQFWSEKSECFSTPLSYQIQQQQQQHCSRCQEFISQRPLHSGRYFPPGKVLTNDFNLKNFPYDSNRDEIDAEIIDTPTVTPENNQYCMLKGQVLNFSLTKSNEAKSLEGDAVDAVLSQGLEAHIDDLRATEKQNIKEQLKDLRDQSNEVPLSRHKRYVINHKQTQTRPLVESNNSVVKTTTTKKQNVTERINQINARPTHRSACIQTENKPAAPCRTRTVCTHVQSADALCQRLTPSPPMSSPPLQPATPRLPSFESENEATTVDENEQHVSMAIFEEIEFNFQRKEDGKKVEGQEGYASNLVPWLFPHQYTATVDKKRQKRIQIREKQSENLHSDQNIIQNSAEADVREIPLEIKEEVLPHYVKTYWDAMERPRYHGESRRSCAECSQAAAAEHQHCSQQSEHNFCRPAEEMELFNSATLERRRPPTSRPPAPYLYFKVDSDEISNQSSTSGFSSTSTVSQYDVAAKHDNFMQDLNFARERDILSPGNYIPSFEQISPPAYKAYHYTDDSNWLFEGQMKDKQHPLARTRYDSDNTELLLNIKDKFPEDENPNPSSIKHDVMDNDDDFDPFFNAYDDVMEETVVEYVPQEYEERENTLDFCNNTFDDVCDFQNPNSICDTQNNFSLQVRLSDTMATRF